MKAYILKKNNTPPSALKTGLEKIGITVEDLKFPSAHEEIPDILKDKESGIVFVPAEWKDLLCVKITHEVTNLDGSFETVIVGSAPDTSNLIVAFNDGLSAFLETGFDSEKLKHIVDRVVEKLKRKSAKREIVSRLASYEAGVDASTWSLQLQERDAFLAKAFVDILKKRGPLYSSGIKVLLVTTSEAQEKRLGEFLKGVGIDVVSVSSMKEGIKAATGTVFRLIIADNMLPDGDAVELVKQLMTKIKSNMPRVLVWSSSPDQISSIMNPNNHIDYVIMKPGPSIGMEIVLPSIIAAAYSSDT